MNAWGIHTIIDLKGCPLDKVTDGNLIRKFIKALIVKIDMVPLWPLMLDYCETHDPKKYGWSFVQMIQDSNITGHFCDIDGSAYLDVFSCKDYDPKDVESLVIAYFQPKEILVRVLERG